MWFLNHWYLRASLTNWSNSLFLFKKLDDLTVEILVGMKCIFNKGPLTKIITRNTTSRKEVRSYICAFRQMLCVLDFSKCSITMVGKEYLEKHFERRCRIIIHSWCKHQTTVIHILANIMIYVQNIPLG